MAYMTFNSDKLEPIGEKKLDQFRLNTNYSSNDTEKKLYFHITINYIKRVSLDFCFTITNDDNVLKYGKRFFFTEKVFYSLTVLLSMRNLTEGLQMSLSCVVLTVLYK